MTSALLLLILIVGVGLVIWLVPKAMIAWFRFWVLVFHGHDIREDL